VAIAIQGGTTPTLTGTTITTATAGLGAAGGTLEGAGDAGADAGSALQLQGSSGLACKVLNFAVTDGGTACTS
jgi:hypothetical protein